MIRPRQVATLTALMAPVTQVVFLLVWVLIVAGTAVAHGPWWAVLVAFAFPSLYVAGAFLAVLAVEWVERPRDLGEDDRG